MKTMEQQENKESNPRLELFLEKIIAKMNLDEAQAAEVGRELRGHLEDAIEDATRRGLPREQAETEALLAFGQPSILARQFGALYGRGWLVFERLVFAIPVYFFYYFFLYRMTRNTPWLASLIAALLALWGASAGVWNEVQVNGVIRIRRFLRRTLVLPFDSIQEVAFEKGHLMGARSIVITHTGGKLELSSKLRNMRCLALAFVALTPSAVRPEVKNFFQRLTLPVRVEGPWFRAFFTLLWLAVLTLIGLGFQATWNIQGFSLWLLIAWPLACAAAWLQGLRHGDRSRRGVCWLILTGTLISIFVFISMLLFSTMQTRSQLILMTAMAAFALFTLWWRGSRATLITAFVCLIIALLGGTWLIPPALTTPTFTLTAYPFHPEAATCLKLPKPAYVAIGWLNNSAIKDFADKDFDKSMQAPQRKVLLWSTAEKADAIPLDPGMWTILPDYAADTMTLAWQEETTGSLNFEESKQYYKRYHETRVYLYKPGEKLKLLETFQASSMWPYRAATFWSPDRTHYLLSQDLSTSESKRGDLKIVSLKDHQARLFEGMNSDMLVWETEHSLLVFLAQSAPPRTPDNLMLTHELWRLDARTGAKERIKTIPMEKALYPYHGKIIQDSIYFDDAIHSRARRYDLADGTTEDLPGSIVKLCASADTRRAAWLLQAAGGLRLIVAEGKLKILDRPLKNCEKIEKVDLSPDGKKLFYTYQNSQGILDEGLISYRMLDLVSGKVEILERFPLLAGWMTSLMELSGIQVKTPFQWSPSGNSVIYPMSTWGIVNKRVQFMCAIRVAPLDRGNHPERPTL